MSKVPHQAAWSRGAVAVTLTAALITAGWLNAGKGTAPVAALQAAAAAPAAARAPAQAAAAKDHIPDLVMLPIEAFHLDYDRGRRILRFSTLISNQGDGPFNIVGSRTNRTTHNLNVVQNIYQSDDEVREVSTKAIMRYSENDDHDHFHVQDFQELKLRPAGSPTWRQTHKEGFCIQDVGRVRGQLPQWYEDCGNDEPETLSVEQGLSIGWVDVYDWYLWGQFVYLDGLKLPGNFCVAASADPAGFFVEKTRKNNATSTLVHITPQDVRVVRQGC